MRRRDWSPYDGFTDKPYNRRDSDLNAVRTVPSGAPDAKGREALEQRWKFDGLYVSTYFLAPSDGAFSWDEIVAKAGGAECLEESVRFARDAPMVVSTSPGLEEAFGRFHAASPEKLGTLEALARSLRTMRGKPVTVGDGGRGTASSSPRFPSSTYSIRRPSPPFPRTSIPTSGPSSPAATA